MATLHFLRCGQNWLVGIVLALALLAARPTQAQVTDSTSAFSDTTAAPLVAPSGVLGGLPSSEFETYNLSGSGVRYTAALTGIYSSGTVERVYFTTSHTANLALGRHWLLPAAFNFSYGRQDGDLREREVLVLTTPAYQRGRLKYYALAEAARSNLRAIDWRVVLGGGVGYQLYLDTLHNEVSISNFILHEHSDYLNGLLRNIPRSSTRLKLRFGKGPLLLTGLAFYQPSLEDFDGDYRVNVTSTLNFTVSQHLALTAAYAFSYESVAVEGRSPDNTNLTVGFTYTTGK